MFLWITGINRAHSSLKALRPRSRKSADHGYKMADDVRMTGLRNNTGKFHN